MRPETVPAFIRHIAAYQDKPAVVAGDRAATYRDLDDASERVALGLLRRGLTKGSKIGLLLANGPEFVIMFLAIARAGGIAVPLSTFMRGRELGRVIRHADLQGLICDRLVHGTDYEHQLGDTLPELLGMDSPDLELLAAPYLRWIVFLDGAEAAWARPASWLTPEPSPRSANGLLDAVELEIVPDDVAIIIYTSGQSADPKGVPHTHRTVVAKTRYLREMMGVMEESTSEAHLPFFWVGGLAVSLLPTLDAGGMVICREGRRAVPPLGATHHADADLPHPGWKGFPALGMSETFGMYSWGRQRSAPGRIYTPLDDFEEGYEVKVVAADGKLAINGARGEICLRGPSVTPGYYKVERRRDFDADGFFQTGDEVEIEGDRLHFTGRLGDLIRTRMANVAPAEVERELVSLEGVAEAYVVGLDDPERGQIVGAAVVAAPDTAVKVEEVARALRRNLSSFKVPRVMAIVSKEDVPKTPTNKVDKRRLRDLVRARGLATSGSA